jgi:hypothetical protein
VIAAIAVGPHNTNMRRPVRTGMTTLASASRNLTVWLRAAVRSRLVKPSRGLSAAVGFMSPVLELPRVSGLGGFL